MESTDERKKALEQWLSTNIELEPNSIQSMQNDASFRRYFRIKTPKGSLVAMDAPPPQENCQAYVAIARALYAIGLRTPEIFASDLERGFLLITDFGDTTYLKALTQQNADQLYLKALDALLVLQGCGQVTEKKIQPFTREFMQQEWAWHKEWFLQGLLGFDAIKNEKELDECYLRIVDSAARQPQVFMHRDYHSANLMVLPDSVGILDFQDAFIGPVTYDLASLLRDCYIDWPEESVNHWASTYWQSLKDLGVLKDVSKQEFLRWFDWMSLQRHLKALLTFARKKVRDHQPGYLKHIPRTLNYLQMVSSRYPEFNVLYEHLQTTVKPAFERVMPECVQ